MPTKSTGTGRNVAAELAYPDPGAQGPVAGRRGRTARRTGPGRDLDPRGVPGRLPATRGRRPRIPRRRGPHPRRPLPGPQDVGGLRLRPPTLPQARDHRPPRAPWTSSPPARTSCSSARPAPARPTCPSGSGIRACQAGHRVAFATAAEWVARLAAAHHAGTAAGRADQTRPGPAADHRRGRLHPVRSRSREPVLPTRLLPLRTRQPDRHQQQALRPLGRGLRRRRRRRRHDRPPRPPRRGHLPQRRQLPAQRPRPRPRPRSRQDQRLTRSTTRRGSIFDRRQGVQIQPPLTLGPARRLAQPARRAVDTPRPEDVLRPLLVRDGRIKLPGPGGTASPQAAPPLSVTTSRVQVVRSLSCRRWDWARGKMRM